MLINIFKEPEDAPRTHLPPFHVSKELHQAANKQYLDFATGLFVSSKKDLSKDDQVWFLEEIAFYLKLSYPTLTKDAIYTTLQQIIQISNQIQKGTKT